MPVMLAVDSSGTSVHDAGPKVVAGDREDSGGRGLTRPARVNAAVDVRRAWTFLAWVDTIVATCNDRSGPP